MAEKQVVLEIAAFLDSAAARALDAPPAETRKLAEHFVSLCYDAVGRKPALLDGEELRTVVADLMPGRLAPRDPLVERAPAVLEAFLDHLEATQVVNQAYELRRELDGAVQTLLARVRSGENAGAPTVAAAADPFVHGAPKLGRNAPCSCGSGKKYKKCHGRDA